MGNVLEPEKIPVNIKKREFKVIKLHIPYNQLSMIKVLQKEFNYEVKGTIYVDHDYQFKSFEVRTDSSEIYSYGASDWRISFHTHPDKTAQKYGIRYFSPPSVDDILEIYDLGMKFVPDAAHKGFGEISIIFTNEGIYLLQVNRESFKKFNDNNLPIEGLEEVLKGTLTDFLVSEVKKGIQNVADGKTINTKTDKVKVKVNVNVEADTDTDKVKVDFDNPDINVEDYARVVKRLARKTSELYGFDMSFYSWSELEKDGLTMNVYDYFVNKKVMD